MDLGVGQCVVIFCCDWLGPPSLPSLRPIPTPSGVGWAWVGEVQGVPQPFTPGIYKGVFFIGGSTPIPPPLSPCGLGGWVMGRSDHGRVHPIGVSMGLYGTGLDSGSYCGGLHIL